MIFSSESELLEYTQEIIGKTFKELDVLNLLSKGQKDKGVLGKIVETGFYKYPLNNNAEADFANLGIELKVTGFKRNKNNTISAKERISLSKIDYFSIIKEEFEFSKLLFKNKKLLLIWYEYTEENKNNWGDFKIYYFQLYDMSIDEEVFKNDFSIIKSKVNDGQAHEISEGDTSYLGACTKGAKGSDTTPQPNNKLIDAKPRAYSLKQSYITGVLRSLNLQNFVPVLSKTVEDYISDILKPYFGMTQIEIWEKLTGERRSLPVPKNFNKMISDRLIGKDNELPLANDIFSKTSYIIKNTSLDEYQYPIERIAFRNLTLSEFSEVWDDSDWKSYYEEVTIILICYEGSKKIPNGLRTLKSVKKISFNSYDLDRFALSYNAIRETIQNGDISYLPIPGSFPYQVLELAPKGTKGDDAYNNFFINDTTRTCFMLEKDFVYSKIQNQ